MSHIQVSQLFHHFEEGQIYTEIDKSPRCTQSAETMNGSACCMLFAVSLHVLLFKPEDGGNMFSKMSVISTEMHGVTAQILFTITAVRISNLTVHH